MCAAGERLPSCTGPPSPPTVVAAMGCLTSCGTRTAAERRPSMRTETTRTACPHARLQNRSSNQLHQRAALVAGIMQATSAIIDRDSVATVI